MADKENSNNKLEIPDETMHKWIVPIMHGTLWFFGLFATKYSAQLLNIDPNKVNVVNMLNVFPAFLVFIFEMAVSVGDIRVHGKTGKRLDVGIVKYLSRFIAVIGVVALFSILYAVKPGANFFFFLLMLFSVVLKFMECYLMNNIDSYFEVRPPELEGFGVNPTIGYVRNQG